MERLNLLNTERKRLKEKVTQVNGKLTYVRITNVTQCFAESCCINYSKLFRHLKKNQKENIELIWRQKI